MRSVAIAPPRRGRASHVRTVAFWTFTFVVVFESAAGALWDLLRIEYVRVIFNHLGYPIYLLFILGAWKLVGAFAVAVPRFPRLKEWAYAGIFFSYSGAAASHLLAGDNVGRWLAPAIFAALAIGSWALRPAERRVSADNALAPEMRPLAWAVPIGAVLLMLAVAYLTLPVGPPPGY